MSYKDYLSITPEIEEAIKEGKPIVALESTILSHGMPYPENVEFAHKVEEIVRAEGAIPATTAIIGGKLKVGLNSEELEIMCKAEGVGKVSRRDVAVFLASMLSDKRCFYYCDEHFSYIQSDIEKRIFSLMVGRLKANEQLIFTTHNSDMLELNLPKHTFAFLRKEVDDGEYKVYATFASEILKRNTDSVRCALENDVFGSLPDDSLLDELEVTV